MLLYDPQFKLLKGLNRLLIKLKINQYLFQVDPRYANATKHLELTETLIEVDISADAEENISCPVCT